MGPLKNKIFYPESLGPTRRRRRDQGTFDLTLESFRLTLGLRYLVLVTDTPPGGPRTKVPVYRTGILEWKSPFLQMNKLFPFHVVRESYREILPFSRPSSDQPKLIRSITKCVQVLSTVPF